MRWVALIALFQLTGTLFADVPPPAVQCPAGSVFTPFSLVPLVAMPSGAQVVFADGKPVTLTPIVGKIVRLDLCLNEAAGTVEFRRLVIKEMKVESFHEVARYTVIDKGAQDTVRGLQEAAFGDYTSFQLTVSAGAAGVFHLQGWPAGEVSFVTFTAGTLHPKGVVPSGPVFAGALEQQDRIALSESACGESAQLEKYAFRVGAFSLQTDACRVTQQFGSRYTFKRVVVADRTAGIPGAPREPLVLSQPAELARFRYQHTHHNANDGWELTVGALTYEMVTTDDVELIGETPVDVKFFRVKTGAATLQEHKIVAPQCRPLSCDVN